MFVHLPSRVSLLRVNLVKPCNLLNNTWNIVQCRWTPFYPQLPLIRRKHALLLGNRSRGDYDNYWRGLATQDRFRRRWSYVC